MDVSSFLNYLVKEKRYSQHTCVAYRGDLDAFEKFVHDEFAESLIGVQSKMVRTWFSSLMSLDMDARTVRRKSSTLNSYYKFLLKRGIINDSPMDGVPLPKQSKNLPKFVDEQRMVDLMQGIVFSEDFKGKRDKLILEVFYHTGVRLSELVNLKIADVDLNKNQLKVLGKRNKERVIPFSGKLSETIKQFLPYRNSESSFLFVTAQGVQVYNKLVYRIVNKYLGKVTTLSQRSPHVLRHTFATHMLDNGAELNAIKELLGHVNLAATEVYTHNSMEKIKLVYKQAHPRA